jgi:homoserine kinase type II
VTTQARPQDLERVLRRLNAGSLHTTRIMRAGPSADVYDVSSSCGRFIVRHLRKYSRVEERLAVHVRGRGQVLNHLRKAGELFPFTVPSYVLDQSGSCVVCIGGNCFEMYGYIDGSTQWRPSLVQTMERGRTLAKFHEALRHTTIDLGDYLWTTPSEVRQRLTLISQSRSHQTNTAFLLAIDVAYSLYSQLAARLPDDDDAFKVGHHVILHGDLHKGNVLYRGDRLHGIVDFDNTTFGPRLLDVARAIDSGNAWHEFVKGYDSVARLDSSEFMLLLKAKALFAVAAFADLALSPTPSNHRSTDLLTHRAKRDAWILRRLAAGDL